MCFRPRRERGNGRASTAPLVEPIFIRPSLLAPPSSPGPAPGIHVLNRTSPNVDGRDKPGHDALNSAPRRSQGKACAAYSAASRCRRELSHR
ncbi:hypothetical protein FO470_17920 [Starkeya sp. 3C]|uniref:Uncharacterized protein n=1 Tax=Ancylobacter moscoviensis TaxID=2597768 RepID=A0ABY3DPQ6_9HYPH|nr:hypothetical protein FO470_17920 [Ancylobacter moscoviensis]